MQRQRTLQAGSGPSSTSTQTLERNQPSPSSSSVPPSPRAEHPWKAQVALGENEKQSCESGPWQEEDKAVQEQSPVVPTAQRRGLLRPGAQEPRILVLTPASQVMLGRQAQAGPLCGGRSTLMFSVPSSQKWAPKGWGLLGLPQKDWTPSPQMRGSTFHSLKPATALDAPHCSQVCRLPLAGRKDNHPLLPLCHHQLPCLPKGFAHTYSFKLAQLHLCFQDSQLTCCLTQAKQGAKKHSI